MTDHTFAVVTDYLEEHGFSWLSLLAKKREPIYRMLLLYESSAETIDQCGCFYAGIHGPHCPFGNLLFMLGGAEEAYRQTTSALEQIALEARPRPLPGEVRPGLVIPRLRELLNR